MTRPADPASRRTWVLGGAGLAALLAITLASPGATRMYSWPWSLAYAAALAAPALLLVLRAFDPRQPLALPSRSWCTIALAFAAIVLASALASTWRGSALQWSAPLLAAVAVFFLTVDWLQAEPAARRSRLLTGAGLCFALIALASIGWWLAGLPGHSAGEIWQARNPFPLGHSNYTAGLALLMLPLFSALAIRDRGARRTGWLAAAGLALVMLFTSGSRGGLAGLVVLVVVQVPTLARTMRWRLGVVIAVGAVALATVVALHPRTRAMFSGAASHAALTESDVQRSAMAEAGLLMAADRPLLGWGPGTTPLAYPRFRAQLAGGVEDVLQLHSLPVQLWAELGVLGLLAALALAVLAVRAAFTAPAVRPVLLGLLGYAAFSLTDWQLDVPVFAFALAAALALLAPAVATAWTAGRVAVGGVTLATVAVVGLLGQRDPTPALNVRALALAGDPATADRAVALFHESLAQNPAQEIAHFNLGWLLVVRDPAAAEEHFAAAARLVPDKGGVYFGLGLARLNRGNRPGAVRAFALECINDPVFLTSPWWQEPAVGATRAAVMALVRQLLLEAALPRMWDDHGAHLEAGYLLALIPWLEGTAGAGANPALANTPERAAYFPRHPAPPDFGAAAVRTYRRERRGYPVLMRQPDLPVALDLLTVQENLLATGECRFLFPSKGWLPAPRLVLLLDDRKP